MFRIEEYDHTADCKTLEISPGLFHDAWKEGVKSRSRFHVRNHGGDDFDIVYYDNNDIEPVASYPKYQKPPFMAPYEI